jgi:mono/diheme cytochrome c family protein
MLRVAVPALALGSFAIVFAAIPKSDGRPDRAQQQKTLSFNAHVQPLLAENCYACHGADPGSRKAGLRLDRAEHAFKPLEKSGPAIIPFKPEESPLVQRIESTDEKQQMPPPEAHKTLQPEQIATLRQWIAEGAEYEEHWSFIPPKRPRVPTVAKLKKPKSPIDAFIAQRLAREGLTLSPEADRRALIRRVTLDLTGVIPTPEEIEAFVKDRSRNAYEKVVDRLLTSPRFGEHRTRYWLDYVRYADTHGIHFDNMRAIWPYRDYVIRAFNSNKPFDAFVREQLAGDLLPVRSFDDLVATGFVRNNMTTNEGGTITEEIYVNQTRDRVEAFGATFLALTTGCAACHDHKFDPFTQKDHYSLAAFLGNTAEKPWDLNIADPEPVLRLPKEEIQTSANYLLLARTELSEKVEARRKRGKGLMTEWLTTGNRPQPVATDGLELRLRLDEGKGDVVKNSAPGAKVVEYKADTNPLVWGENSWFWPSMRMDILSRLSLGDLGDVDTTDKFSAGGWIMLRAKPGGGIKAGTGNGALLARMGDEKRKGGAGWDIFNDNLQIVVNLMADNTPPAPAEKPDAAPEENVKDPAPAAPAAAVNPPPTPEPPVKRGIQVATRQGEFVRDDWIHVFVTYDGTKKASGVKIYLNGKLAETDVKLDTLKPEDSIRTDAAMHLGRRDDYQPMRETRYQDVRFYRRALAADEVARLPFEDVAAEIVARKPDPAKWTTDEHFVAVEKFFLGEKDGETMKLANAVSAHDAALEALTKEGTATLIAREKPTPAYADILKRGDYYARSERVEPAVPHFLPPLPKNAPANRRGLAEWLLMPEQPLMARVTVNRMWQEVFGRGLVESAGDFGIMGDRPSHPELLDWLAVEFRESGWNVKNFYRLLVTSASYRQTTTVTPERLAKDPDNKLLSRGPRFRMDGEMLRDNALLAAGLLVERIGGPPTKPYHPAGIWEEVAMPESNTKTYVQDQGEGLYRRSVYTFWKRSSPPVSFETFDATSREVVCTRRARTNTPLQAFVTMNDPQWVEAARKLAERALKATPTTKDRFAFLSQATLGRELADKELAVLSRSLDTFHQRFANEQAMEDVKALLAVGESKSDPSLAQSELAAWTMVASQFLNLDEFLTK